MHGTVSSNQSAKVEIVFNFYFESVTESLELLIWEPEPYDHDKKEKIIQNFSHHPSIIKIKQNIKISKNIFFISVTVETVINSINELPQNKSVNGVIP